MQLALKLPLMCFTMLCLSGCEQDADYSDSLAMNEGNKLFDSLTHHQYCVTIGKPYQPVTEFPVEIREDRHRVFQNLYDIFQSLGLLTVSYAGQDESFKMVSIDLTEKGKKIYFDPSGSGHGFCYDQFKVTKVNRSWGDPYYVEGEYSLRYTVEFAFDVTAETPAWMEDQYNSINERFRFRFRSYPNFGNVLLTKYDEGGWRATEYQDNSFPIKYI